MYPYIWDIFAMVLLDVSSLPLTWNSSSMTVIHRFCLLRVPIYVLLIHSYCLSHFLNILIYFHYIQAPIICFPFDPFYCWSFLFDLLIFHFEYFNLIFFQSFSLLNSSFISCMESIISFCYLFVFSWNLFRSLFMSSLISFHSLITKLLNSLSGISFLSLHWKLLLWN